MKKFYLHNGSSQEGPFDIDDLKSKNISKNTQIWYDGIPDWQQASSVSELKELFAAAPPPFHKTTNRPAPEKSNSVFGKRLLSAMACFVLILVAFYIYGQIQQNKIASDRQFMQTLNDDQKQRIRENIYDYVKVGNSAYNYRLVGGISNLSLTLNNVSGYMIDDVKVKLSFIKADGGLWKDIIVDFTYIENNHTNTISIPDEPRGISIRYQIESIKSTSLGLH